jgi:NAD(P)H dehydrogenase (quinone)
MQILVVLAHPDPNSLNHALAQAVVTELQTSGHSVIFHDLYGERFDPRLPAAELGRNAELDPVLAEHCAQLAAAEGLVFVHPNWWGQPPAILKGWIDRVLRAGVAYRFLEGDCGEGVPVGLLQARTALIINTSNTEEQREAEVFGDPLETLWKRCIFGLCGVEDFHRKTYRVVCTSSETERRQWLADAAEMTRLCFPAEL